MEVELRAKIKNIDEVQEKLKALGATYVKTQKLEDHYFGDIGLYEKLGRSFWIRLRVKNGKIELAYKGPTETDGVYEEYEQELQDFETAKKIFEKSGLVNAISVVKERISYKLENINIEIDSIQGKGDFIELEIISENVDKTALFDLFAKLNIPQSDVFEKGFITQFLKEEGSPFSKWVVN